MNKKSKTHSCFTISVDCLICMLLVFLHVIVWYYKHLHYCYTGVSSLILFCFSQFFEYQYFVYVFFLRQEPLVIYLLIHRARLLDDCSYLPWESVLQPDVRSTETLLRVPKQMNRKCCCTVHSTSVSINRKMLKFLHLKFYVMDKELTDELSCMWTGLVRCMCTHPCFLCHFERETTFVTACLLSWVLKPCLKGAYL